MGRRRRNDEAGLSFSIFSFPLFHLVQPFSILTFLFSTLGCANTACAPKCGEGKGNHRNRIGDGKRDQPQNRARLPLTPGRERAIQRKNQENRPDGLVKKLAGDAPERSQRNERRAPQDREQPRIHGHNSKLFPRLRPLFRAALCGGGGSRGSRGSKASTGKKPGRSSTGGGGGKGNNSKGGNGGGDAARNPSSKQL